MHYSVNCSEAPEMFCGIEIFMRVSRWRWIYPSSALKCYRQNWVYMPDILTLYMFPALYGVYSRFELFPWHHRESLFIPCCEHLYVLCLLVFTHYKTSSYVWNNGSPVPLLFSFQREMCRDPPCLSQKAWLSSANHSYPVTQRHGAGRSGGCVAPRAGLNFSRSDLFPPK